jgi:hypothetical protein
VRGPLPHCFLDGNTAVMLGKITKVAFKADK